MTKLLAFIGAFALLLCTSNAQVKPSTNATARIPNLIIAASSAPVTGGKVTLSIGTLAFKTGIYVGEYHIKVSPYFFKNEKGQLAINAPDESVRKLTNGASVNFTGKATSSSGKVKQIQGIVTPSTHDHGNVSLWFMVGDSKMTFNTSYRCGMPELVPAKQ